MLCCRAMLPCHAAVPCCRAMLPCHAAVSCCRAMLPCHILEPSCHRALDHHIIFCVFAALSTAWRCGFIIYISFQRDVAISGFIEAYITICETYIKTSRIVIKEKYVVHARVRACVSEREIKEEDMVQVCMCVCKCVRV